MSANSVGKLEDQISASIKLLRSQVQSSTDKYAAEIAALAGHSKTAHEQLCQQIEDCIQQWERSRSEVLAMLERLVGLISGAPELAEVGLHDGPPLDEIARHLNGRMRAMPIARENGFHALRGRVLN